MKVKVCQRCKKRRLAKKFYISRENKSKLSSYCIECCSIRSKERRMAKPELCKQKQREYYLNNKERCLESCKRYRDETQYNKKYHQENKERCNRLGLESHHRRYKNDLAYRMLHLSRGRMAKLLKGISESENSLELLGCNREQLKVHLESKFKPGMTWENQGRGGWQVDHIKPCASFDLSKESERKECFHYTNLQPLWAKENNSKKAKYQGIDYQNYKNKSIKNK